MKGSELFLKTISKLGIKNGFGIVGGEAQAIQFDEAKDIHFYLTRHEFAAGIMADVYSRITDQPQMCYSTFGPGLTNLSTGVFSAIQDRSPVLAVSAQIHTKEVRFNQTHQCIDNVSFMKTITKYSTQIENVHDIPSIVKHALEIAVNGIPGPVYISFPYNYMEEQIDDELANKLLLELMTIQKIDAPEPNHKELDRVIERINNAKHPIIIAGNQVIRDKCSAKLLNFIEKTNIPILSTLASKGVISEDHPLFITPCNKYIDQIYRDDLIKHIFSSCDLILLLGYDFGEDLKPTLWNNKIQNIVLNSFYEDMGQVFKPDMLCLGSLAKILDYFIEADIDPKLVPKNIKKVRSIFSERKADHNNGSTTDISSIIKSIRNSIGKDGILCSDIGLHKQYAGLLSKAYLPNTFLCSNVCGTFGFGLPAALAVKLAKPEARVSVICGDGGCHSTSHDIETAIRYNLPIVIVILNDNAFGLIKYYQLIERDDIFSDSVEFGKVDFVKLAEANGMQGILLNDISMLKKTMDTAFETEKSLLIEIPVKYKYDLTTIEAKEKIEDTMIELCGKEA